MREVWHIYWQRMPLFSAMIGTMAPMPIEYVVLPKMPVTLMPEVSDQACRALEHQLSNLDTELRLEHRPWQMRRERHIHPKRSFYSCGILLDSTWSFGFVVWDCVWDCVWGWD
jgi:hypothetical protein